MKRRLLQILFLGIVIAFGGCYSLSTYQNADTTREGKVSGGIGISVLQFVESDSNTDVIDTNEFMKDYQLMELFLRYGLTDNMDLELKLYASNLSLGWKWRFLDLSIFRVAFYGGAVYTNLLITSGYGAFANLILDINPTKWLSIYLGPKYMYTHYNFTDDFEGSGLPDNYYGGFLGLKFKLKAINILLEVNAYKVVFDMKDASMTSDEGFVIQPGIALQFGY